MRIYTKTGDKGDTSLFGGQRVPKDALRIEAYGTIDELNAVLGCVLADNSDSDLDMMLIQIQNQLFELGADLATPRSGGKGKVRRIAAEDSAVLEGSIDKFQSSLQPLNNFILPGGSRTASYLHLARTVCRRAERIVVRLSRNEDIGEEVIVFLNRLSDLLFVLSRFMNQKAGIAEAQWNPARLADK